MMSNRDFTIAEAREIIRNNRETLLAVDIEGNIKNCIPINPDNLSLEEFSNLIKIEKHKGCSVSFIKQDINITEEQVVKKIKDSVEALEYSKTHKMKPGVNIPDEKAMQRYMKIYNAILRSFYISGCILDENGRGIEGEIFIGNKYRGLTFRTKEDGCFSEEFSTIRFRDRFFKQVLSVSVKAGPDKYEEKMQYRFRFAPGRRLKLKFYPFSNRVEESIEKVK